jgi:hypothetical protein
MDHAPCVPTPSFLVSSITSDSAHLKPIKLFGGLEVLTQLFPLEKFLLLEGLVDWAFVFNFFEGKKTLGFHLYHFYHHIVDGA